MTDTFRKFIAELVPPVGELPHKEFDEHQTYASEAEALHAYQTARTRLLHPQRWEELTHHLGAHFEPFSADHKAISGPVALGNFLKIVLPIPGDPYHDWVVIETLEEQQTIGEEQLIGMRVRPTEDLEQASHSTAHFFGKEATSTWVLHQHRKTVSAYYYGRGEVRNEEAESFWKKLRDTVVAWAGVAGFSNLQWKGLLAALLPEPSEA
jgi:hypothetical protein